MADEIELPQTGGTYERLKDGSLKRLSEAEPKTPPEETPVEETVADKPAKKEK